MNRKNIILAAAVLIVLGAAVLVGLYLGRQHPTAGEYSPYSAVTLVNGEVYFGRLDWFPKPRLKDAWVLQRSVDQDGQVQMNVGPWSKSIWSPASTLYLNPTNIATWSRLRADSPLAQAIADPNSVGAVDQQPTSTFKGPSTPPPGQQ